MSAVNFQVVIIATSQCDLNVTLVMYSSHGSRNLNSTRATTIDTLIFHHFDNVAVAVGPDAPFFRCFAPCRSVMAHDVTLLLLAGAGVAGFFPPMYEYPQVFPAPHLGAFLKNGITGAPLLTSGAGVEKKSYGRSEPW